MKKDSALFKWIWVVLCFFGLLLSGCAGSIKNLPLNAWVQPVSSGTQSDDRFVYIAYLGTGGYLIRQGERTILTAPFFSHPSIPQILLGRIKADKKPFVQKVLNDFVLGSDRQAFLVKFLNSHSLISKKGSKTFQKTL